MLIGTAACVESPAFAAGLLTFLLFFCGRIRARMSSTLRNVPQHAHKHAQCMHSHLQHARSPLYDPLAGLARSFLKK
jgi:hypothetical protein